MRRVIGLLVVGGLAATGCGSSSSDTNASSSSETAYESPLYDFLGIDTGGGDPDAEQAKYEEMDRQVNEQVTACMTAEGFEWKPDPQMAMSFSAEPTDGLEWGTKEWTAKYGFGISTQSFEQSQLGPDLVGYDDSAYAQDEEYVDPNADYLATLSPAENEAFYAALYGGEDSYGPEWDESLSDEENNQIQQDWYENEYVPTGCYTIAQEEIYNQGGANDVWTEFSDELDAMYERIASDPRIIEAEAKIASCVADKGFTYSTMDDVYTTFNDRLTPLYDAQNAAYENMDDPFAGMTEEEMAALTEEDYAAFDQGPPPLPADMLTELGVIQKDEIAMAVAVDECGGGYNNQESIYNEVRIELEQEFVDTNREALEALKTDG